MISPTGKCNIAQNADRQLASGDELLDHDLSVETQRFVDRGLQLLGLLHDRKPDRRSLLAGFTITGKPSCARTSSIVAGASKPISRRYAGLTEQVLRHVLVERKSAREVPASGVRHSRQVQEGLDRAVLPDPP